jgi:hypothetical protein
MHTEALRNCDACGQPHGAIVYDINVRVSILSGQTGERLQVNHSGTADLQLCPNCMCGMNSHALPLAMDHRARQLDHKPQTACQIYHLPDTNNTKGNAA